jgi:hypothetical protein
LTKPLSNTNKKIINKIDHDIHNKEFHTADSEVEKLHRYLKAAYEENESFKTRIKLEHEVVFSLKAEVSDLKLIHNTKSRYNTNIRKRSEL